MLSASRHRLGGSSGNPTPAPSTVKSWAFLYAGFYFRLLGGFQYISHDFLCRVWETTHLRMGTTPSKILLTKRIGFFVSSPNGPASC
jgi:hypothetical protein